MEASEGVVSSDPPPIVLPPSSPSPSPSPSPPPSFASSWSAQWSQTLSTRRANEEAAKSERLKEAAESVEKFEVQARATREAKMSKNRSEEQVKLESLEADLDSDNPWERVVKLVDLQMDEEEEKGRMRSILIQMKNEPVKV